MTAALCSAEKRTSLDDDQGRSDGGYIGIYTPKNQSTLNFFMWLFCLLAITIVNIYTHPNQIPGYASDDDNHRASYFVTQNKLLLPPLVTVG